MQQHPMVVGDFLVNVEGQIEATMSKLLLRTERHPEITQISDLVCLFPVPFLFEKQCERHKKSG